MNNYVYYKSNINVVELQGVMSHTVYLSQLLRSKNCDIVHMQSFVNTSSKALHPLRQPRQLIEIMDKHNTLRYT